MKSKELHQELRERILNLPGVIEQQNAGIHGDAFFVGRTMFMHIHGRRHCDIRLTKADQARVLAEGKARAHRWAPQAGYVTSIVKSEEDLEQTMELIQISYRHFASHSAARSNENGAGDHELRTLKLFVIGATGRTGREVVQQALARGHRVTAFVRSPESITATNERLNIIKGDAMDEEQLF